MFCKFCGKDIGELRSCPICNDGKSIPEKKKVAESISHDQSEVEAKKIQKKKDDHFSSFFESKVKLFGLLNTLIIIVMMFLSYVLAFQQAKTMSFTKDRLFFDILNMFYSLWPVIMIVALTASVLNITEVFIFRNFVNRESPSLSMLLSKTVVDGEFKAVKKARNIWGWRCVCFSESKKATGILIAYHFATLGTTLSVFIIGFFYLASLISRYPYFILFFKELNAGFFLSPLGISFILVIILNIVPSIVFTLLRRKCYAEMKDNCISKFNAESFM